MKILLVLFFLLVSSFCFASNLKEESSQYINSRNYESLENLSKAIEIGMSKEEVEQLLGEADYSPTVGIYYYSSDRYIYHINRPRTTVGLVITYSEKNGQSHQRVKSINLGPIGE